MSANDLSARAQRFMRDPSIHDPEAATFAVSTVLEILQAMDARLDELAGAGEGKRVFAEVWNRLAQAEASAPSDASEVAVVPMRLERRPDGFYIEPIHEKLSVMGPFATAREAGEAGARALAGLYGGKVERIEHVGCDCLACSSANETLNTSEEPHVEAVRVQQPFRL